MVMKALKAILKEHFARYFEYWQYQYILNSPKSKFEGNNSHFLDNKLIWRYS